jgi:hypothetical protein
MWGELMNGMDEEKDKNLVIEHHPALERETLIPWNFHFETVPPVDAFEAFVVSDGKRAYFFMFSSLYGRLLSFYEAPFKRRSVCCIQLHQNLWCNL